MERDFYTDEFEELIKAKADQYRMYPSERVWKGIKRSLHSNRRKYWFGFALLLTGLSYFGIDQLIVSPPQIAKSTPETTTPEKPQAKIIPFTEVIPRSVEQNRATSTDVPTAAVQALPKQEIFIRDDRQSPPVNAPVAGVTADEDGGTSLTPGSTASEDKIESSRIIGLDRLHQDPVQLEPTLAPSLTAVILPKAATDQSEEDLHKINWLQEFAVYDLSPTKPQRINWQISFAPTMNYRKLVGRNNANIQSSAGNIPIALSIEGDLDKLVNHKPALGFELGSYLVYSLNHNLALKGGLQFNYSRYEIQAYSSATERATISLNSINGFTSSSISNLTQLRNFGGYAVQELQNQYFQLSVPLGIELNLLGSGKLQLGVAGTVQPTYLLNRNNYLISSDYKNYTKEPSLMRRWNVNTSAETFVSYKTAGLKWQVGPQIRYQLLSTFTDKYQIKEYLIEYGVKIGVTKTIR